jgi:glycosyltransferase involved in cell wall biosynthesis
VNTPLVSVIIPNYNYAQYVREAVNSALEQTYPNIEVIVLDDGSTDDSRTVIESYGDKIKAIFQKNQGVSAARNNGAAQASGQYLAFLDSDDVWRPEKLMRQIERFAADPNLGLIHVGTIEFDETGVLREELEGMEGDVARELLLFERPVILGGGSGIVIPRHVFDDVGGFDGKLSTSADWDLFYRISRGHKVGFVSEILLRYRVHGSNMHGNIQRMEREMLIGYRKAFENGAAADKRTCYGNLHKTLAGSYFYAGQYGDFVRHMVKSIWNRPSNAAYFAGKLLRRSNNK